MRYFLLLNQDCYLEAAALDVLVSYMEAHPVCGICAPLQVAPGDPERVVWAGGLQAFPVGWHIGGRASEHKQPAETAWANGAAMLVRRAVVQEIGLLDRNLRFLCSDCDYSLTARSRGWKVVMHPGARCVHEFGSSRPGPSDDPLERVKAFDLLHFADKWISGHLYGRLSAEGAALDLADLRRVRDSIAEQLGAGAPSGTQYFTLQP